MKTVAPEEEAGVEKLMLKEEVRRVEVVSSEEEADSLLPRLSCAQCGYAHCGSARCGLAHYGHAHCGSRFYLP